MDFFSTAWQRFNSSYYEEVAKHEARVAAGSQPNFPFMDLYRDTLPAIAVYLVALAVLYVWMQQRKEAFSLKRLLMVYNAVCVLLAGAVVLGLLFTLPDKFVCNSLDVSSDRGILRANIMWLYYAQKYFEFLDTVFFILRKSWRQVTFLHVYHHASVALVTREFMLYDINGDSYLAVLLNSFIHVLMYSHYLLAAAGVKTWWRPYLTQLQLLQFTTILVQMITSYNIGPDCGLPDYLKVLQIVYMVTMLLLFANFYLNAYKDDEKPSKGQSKDKKQQ